MFQNGDFIKKLNMKVAGTLPYESKQEMNESSKVQPNKSKLTESSQNSGQNAKLTKN